MRPGLSPASDDGTMSWTHCERVLRVISNINRLAIILNEMARQTKVSILAMVTVSAVSACHAPFDSEFVDVVPKYNAYFTELNEPHSASLTLERARVSGDKVHLVAKRTVSPGHFNGLYGMSLRIDEQVFETETVGATGFNERARRAKQSFQTFEFSCDLAIAAANSPAAFADFIWRNGVLHYQISGSAAQRAFKQIADACTK